MKESKNKPLTSKIFHLLDKSDSMIPYAVKSIKRRVL